MTQTEAFKKLDAWLLVPISYQGIIPALAAIANTQEYASYLKKVADADYRSVESVKKDVDDYLQKEAANPKPSLDQMLSKISGKENRHFEDEINKAAPDILDDLAHQKDQKIHGLSESEQLDKAYKDFVYKEVNRQIQEREGISDDLQGSQISLKVVALPLIIIIVFIMIIILMFTM